MIRRTLLLLLAPLLALSIACNAAGSGGPVQPARAPVTSPATPAPGLTPAGLPTATEPVPDTGWGTVDRGLEYRLRQWFDPAGKVIEAMHLVRVDPAVYELRVAYAPGAPVSVREWAVQSGAMITLNAGYFTPEMVATGLLIADGVPHGTSYEGFGGMVVMSAAGIDVRSLEEEPYLPGEALTAAVQSFPLLIKPGGAIGYPEEDGIPSRRAVIGQDGSGRIVIVVCPNGTLTLHALAVELMTSDLELDVALNLDGGTSAGLWVASESTPVRVPSLTAVPAVLIMDPRN